MSSFISSFPMHTSGILRSFSLPVFPTGMRHWPKVGASNYFKLFDEQKAIKNSAKEFAKEEFPLIVRECDREERLDLNWLNKARKLGFVGVYIPKKYGARIGLF